MISLLSDKPSFGGNFLCVHIKVSLLRRDDNDVDVDDVFFDELDFDDVVDFDHYMTHSTRKRDRV